MSKQSPIENKIYASIIAECEKMEANKTYKGNGHHLAQRLTAMVSAGILSKQQKKIYDNLSESYKSTAEISEELKINTKHVSSQLLQMENQTLLISKEKRGNKNYWKKYL